MQLFQGSCRVCPPSTGERRDRLALLPTCCVIRDPSLVGLGHISLFLIKMGEGISTQSRLCNFQGSLALRARPRSTRIKMWDMESLRPSPGRGRAGFGLGSGVSGQWGLWFWGQPGANFERFRKTHGLGQFHVVYQETTSPRRAGRTLTPPKCGRLLRIS